jgi:hypothetical protein
MDTAATTPCEWCGVSVTRPGKPCSALTEPERQALRAAIMAGSTTDEACLRALRQRGILPRAA